MNGKYSHMTGPQQVIRQVPLDENAGLLRKAGYEHDACTGGSSQEPFYEITARFLTGSPFTCILVTAADGRSPLK